MLPEITILFTSDMHGSRRCWRRFVDYSIEHKADFAVIGGDLSGKTIAPIEMHGAGLFVSNVSASRRTFGESEIPVIEKELSNEGLYPVLMTPAEREALRRDANLVSQVFLRNMRERLEQWVWDATVRFRTTGTRLIVMPGNDDPWELDEFLETLIDRGANAANPDRGPLDNKLGGKFFGVSWVNTTPFCCPRDKPDEEIAARLERELNAVSPEVMKSSIFVFHAPPLESGLDIAPQLDKEMRPVTRGGSVVNVPCGSRAVRLAIEQYQPVVSLHGHIHESPGRVVIGRTVCFNPGSIYNAGKFNGYLIKLTAEGVVSWLRIQD